MTTFTDGPAKGQCLMLKRAVKFLRVAKAPNGKFHALVQLYDEPAPREELFAYTANERPRVCHINAGRGRGGFFPLISYRLCADQPSQEIMRCPLDWGDWCAKQPPRNDLE
jgi:hypothetical protein